MSGFDCAMDFEDPPTASGPRRSWRNPLLSDWRLQVGTNFYDVHRADLAEGSRGSEFFLTLFQRWDGNNRSTDLTELLPEPCWHVFDLLLDFVYGGAVDLTAETAVPLFKSAHILRMHALCQLSVKYLKANFTKKAAPVVLLHSLQLGPGLEGFVAEAVSKMAENFNAYDVSVFTSFPVDAVVQILQHPLRRADPHRVSNVVAAILRWASAHSDAEYMFTHLSAFVEDIGPEDAFLLLAASIDYGHDTMRSRCFAVAEEHFEWLSLPDICLVRDVNLVIELLDSDELRAHEDYVFDAIHKYILGFALELSSEQTTRMWSTCRFAFLSLDRLCGKALHMENIPQPDFKVGLAARLVLKEKGDEAFATFVSDQKSNLELDEHVRSRLKPRKPPTYATMCYDMNGATVELI